MREYPFLKGFDPPRKQTGSHKCYFRFLKVMGKHGHVVLKHLHNYHISSTEFFYFLFIGEHKIQLWRRVHGKYCFLFMLYKLSPEHVEYD